jgi:small subunit ribosomal protein S17
MAEEEKQETEETTEPEATGPEATEAEAVEEPTPEAEAAEGAPEAEAAEEPPEAEAVEEPAEAEAVEEPAPEAQAVPAPEPTEPEEVLSPKERRRRERSRSAGPARPTLTPDERAAERAERRRAAATRRRRYRAVQRGKRGEPGQGTPPAAPEPGSKKVRQGTVVAAGANKTITVEIPVVRRHPTYEKVERHTSKLHAHDESNQAQQGDVVRVIESRPLSRTKRWRLLDVVERSRR